MGAHLNCTLSHLFQSKVPVSSSVTEPLPATRQLSTASSLDEILSSSPTGRSEAQTDNVLAPKVNPPTPSTFTSEPLPAARQLSTASSLDEILSSSPTGRSEAQTDNVLAPKVNPLPPQPLCRSPSQLPGSYQQRHH